MDGTNPERLARSVNAQEVNCTPWSEWMMPPPCGSRFVMAMLSALVTSAAVWLESIDQPTTRREKVSSTTAQYTLPS